ncbi:STAS domain-containing protein [Streptomyces sp. NPDC127079]|uniref:STAS domain-containing protein n=1 Tax=Streptomyces sp. NPDC127079 TaxID=3347132 RepID=UPI003654F418
MNGAGGITTLVARDSGVHSVGVFGELDTFTGDELVTVVRECLEQQPVRLVVDLSAVSFCDGAGVRALMTMRELAVQAGTPFALTGLRAPTLIRVLEITGCDVLFGLSRHPAAHPDSSAC